MATADFMQGDKELQDAYSAFRHQQDKFRGLSIKEDSSPVPQWLKNADLTMVNINPAYENVFNVRRSDYVGSDDFKVWPKVVAKSFRENDRQVLDESITVHCIEIVPGTDGAEEMPLYVMKYPVRGDDFSGVGGMCVPLKWVLRAALDELGREKLCELIG